MSWGLAGRRLTLIGVGLCWAACWVAMGQVGRIQVIDADLASPRMVVNGRVEALPVIRLGGADGQLEVSFDDLTPAYRRYTYSLEHCDYAGETDTEDVFDSEAVQTVADEEPIADYAPSRNTTVQYTHYRLSLPNAQVRPLLSGNYRLRVLRADADDEPQVVLTFDFGVVDNCVGVRATCGANTEVDWNAHHQQLDLTVETGDLALRDAENEIRTVVMQNRRWDAARVGVPPTAVNGNRLIWSHCREFTFAAMNEYRKMEMTSTRYPGLHGDRMVWADPFYHYVLQADAPRKHYLYDEDQDGRWMVHMANNADADTEADYVMTHFTLAAEELTDASVYVLAGWTGGALDSRYRMTYDAQRGAYEAQVLMKLGYYNYLYVTASADAPSVGHTALMEGNFYQTENEYDVLVYYRPTGGRYWQLVGCIAPIYRP